jgi:hypothetical protein
VTDAKTNSSVRVAVVAIVAISFFISIKVFHGRAQTRAFDEKAAAEFYSGNTVATVAGFAPAAVTAFLRCHSPSTSYGTQASSSTIVTEPANWGCRSFRL